MRFEPGILKGNGLFYGDNLYIMQELLHEGYAEKFDMIYFDGPFNSGWFFSVYNEELAEEIIDPWNQAATVRNFYNPMVYRSNYQKRIQLAKELLHETGLLVFHTSQKEGHYLKVILDEIFGSGNFLGEVIWKFADEPVYKKSQFGLNHETLFFYSKTKNYFKKHEVCYSSVWDDIDKYENLGEENTFYATQKPEKLIERILQMTTDEDALVGDFYCGSGTLPVVAERMKRRWIASDNSRMAIQTAVERMSAHGISTVVYQLIEDFNLSYLQGNEYRKKTAIPFSAHEFEGLRQALKNTPVTVHAYEYAPDIDGCERENATLQLIMPSLTSTGMNDAVTTTIPRPELFVSRDGYQITIKDPLNWVLYHIKHGIIEDENYRIDVQALQERAKKVYTRINQNWIQSITEYDQYILVKDVFGYLYKMPR